ncbi:hypothetical protein QCA50_004777 [Cerrena zonata]|uniref:XPG-I domain-containing protein n=1 Tax=Cerrena zonata TaxID=2478898 RepID=A0AAW0GD58_9APHY
MATPPPLRVQRLWKLIESSGKTYESLNVLALRCGYFDHPAAKGYRLGVNASDWLRVTHATALAGPAAQLRLLFNQLARLLSTLTNVIFVFDAHPAEDVMLPQHVMDSFITMTAACGFHVHTAPGDALAELGTLSALGKIDAVLTKDVRAFLYGALSVVVPVNLTHIEQVTVYEVHHILAENRITRGDMVLAALMLEFQYHNSNAQPLIVTRALARYGFGDRLLHAIEDFGDEVPLRFIHDWTCEFIDYLRRDPLNYVGSSCETLVSSLPTLFPNLKIARGYVRPVTSTAQVLSTQHWLLTMPDIHGILQMCIKLFSSPTGNLMFERLKPSINTGVAFRALLQETITQDEKCKSLTRLLSTQEPFTSEDSPEIKVEDCRLIHEQWILKIRIVLPVVAVDDVFCLRGASVLYVPAPLVLRARPQCKLQLHSALRIPNPSPNLFDILTGWVDPDIEDPTSINPEVIDLTRVDDDTVIDLTNDDSDSDHA